MTEAEHGYALGFVALRGRVREGVLEFPVAGDAEAFLERLAAKTASDIPAPHELRGELVRIQAPLAAVATSFLGAEPGDREGQHFPSEEPRVQRAFARGLLDGAGSVSAPRERELKVKCVRPGARLLDQLVELVGVAPVRLGKQSIHWTGLGALDMLGHLYAELVPSETDRLFQTKNLRRFWAWASKIDAVRQDRGVGALRVQRLRDDAVLPSKERVSDSGYDLTLLYEKSRHGQVVFYGTGLSIEPPPGWYFDVVARSSIVKRGHMLANNVGIIDRAYRGEILVPFIKIDSQAPALTLPARVAQLIPRPVVHFPVIEASLGETSRGSGGFGSSG